jgi:hypothetical protein
VLRIGRGPAEFRQQPGDSGRSIAMVPWIEVNWTNRRMISRKLALPVILATAAGTPYLLLEQDVPSMVRQQTAALFSAESEPAEGELGGMVGSDYPGRSASEYGYGARAAHPEAAFPQGITGPPLQDLGEVIRFDIPPSWVTSRWPRVTTTLSETGLEGLRVPLVTGTQVDDLAGSLTYYFDPQHRVQRLTFEGFTGDDRRLVALVVQYYGLQAEPTLHAGMYVARWNARPTSVLRITRSPVMTAASPHSQLQVLLELNRPGMVYGLSPVASQILEYDRNSWRW